MAYNGIQNWANDTAVKNDLASAAKKLEMIKVDLNRYPNNAGEFPSDGFSVSRSSYRESGNNFYYCRNVVTDVYAIGAISKSGKGIMVTASGIQEGVTVGWAATCTAIGATAGDTASAAPITGYSSGAGGWQTSWSWMR